MTLLFITSYSVLSRLPNVLRDGRTIFEPLPPSNTLEYRRNSESSTNLRGSRFFTTSRTKASSTADWVAFLAVKKNKRKLLEILTNYLI